MKIKGAVIFPEVFNNSGRRRKIRVLPQEEKIRRSSSSSSRITSSSPPGSPPPALPLKVFLLLAIRQIFSSVATSYKTNEGEVNYFLIENDLPSFLVLPSRELILNLKIQNNFSTEFEPQKVLMVE